MNAIETLHGLGQSIWYDNIERRLLENGELAALIARGEIRGLTSNPSIFHNAIARSTDYDAALTPMAWAGYTSGQIYEELVIEDIRTAADLLRPLYEQSRGGDGYVSLEVSPRLARDSRGTLEEALRLWGRVDRPNLMIKIPATKAGLPAVRRAIAAGLNINVTLIFSLTRYVQVMDAYLSGLEDRLAAGQAVDEIASVASFFVSRLDTKADQRLAEIVQQGGARAAQAKTLMGKLAIANSRLAYQEFRKAFESQRFLRLQERGARIQRPLWASTSTKNPAYPDTIYVDGLIGPNTINTVPPQTLRAFADHGKAMLTLEQGVDAARQAMADAEALGISMTQVTQELEMEGVKAFAQAFKELLKTIEKRRKAAARQLGPLAGAVAQEVMRQEAASFPARLHAGDPTLWTDDPQGQAEVGIRLGWLPLPETSRLMLESLNQFAAQARGDGFTHALLLGMGGSSLAPEVLRLICGVAPVGLDLAILDSTDPAQVYSAARRSPVEHTLYIVASKSGGTAEVNAFLDYFWARTKRKLGAKAGQSFVAITDPGTSLEKLAQERGFRQVFLADPNVGGRYSALSVFGLLPAVLLGLDGAALLDQAAWMAHQCRPEHPAGRNPGLVLGAIMGQAARQGRDKLTLIADASLQPLGAWLEQLIAESTGKQGVGVVPVDGEPLMPADQYGDDRLFVYLRREGRYNRAAARLQKAGLPVLVFDLPDGVDLGAEFYRWEVATAIACAVLGVNAFDQPDVQDSKTRTKANIAVYRERGAFDEGQPVWEKDGMRLYGDLLQGVDAVREALAAFLEQAQRGDYVAINAYLPRNLEMQRLLRHLRIDIQERAGLPTTLGFGPRFLHSTGQLHKGGADNGLFLQITADPVNDLAIPQQGMTFGALQRGQALGDLDALRARSRRVLRIHLPKPRALKRLLEK